MTKRITAAYYDPKSASIRILSETSELVGYIDTRDLADLVSETLQRAVRDMHTDHAVKVALEAAEQHTRALAAQEEIEKQQEADLQRRRDAEKSMGNWYMTKDDHW